MGSHRLLRVGELLKREATDFPSRANENRQEYLRGSEIFSGKALPNSVEAGDQDATVAKINLTGIGPGLVPVVG